MGTISGATDIKNNPPQLLFRKPKHAGLPYLRRRQTYPEISTFADVGRLRPSGSGLTDKSASSPAAFVGAVVSRPAPSLFNRSLQIPSLYTLHSRTPPKQTPILPPPHHGHRRRPQHRRRRVLPAALGPHTSANRRREPRPLPFLLLLCRS